MESTGVHMAKNVGYLNSCQLSRFSINHGQIPPPPPKKKLVILPSLLPSHVGLAIGTPVGSHFVEKIFRLNQSLQLFYLVRWKWSNYYTENAG